jgi:transposase-like protein
MMQRGGGVVIKMLANVQQKTIEPFIKNFIARGSLVYTDEYCIYDRLEKWGYQHSAVNHSAGEYARDEDGDGFHEVHVNSMESLACAKDGRSCGLGSVLTAASPKKSCRCTWASLSSFTTSGGGAGPCCRPSLRFW